MKGSTHLAIGAAIGIAAALHYPFRPETAACYVAAASFSALSADLDGANLLSSKLGKVSRSIRELLLWGGLFDLLLLAGRYYFLHRFDSTFALIGSAVALAGLLMKEGWLRNVLVSLCGLGLLYAGWRYGSAGLVGLGVFVAWAPWLKHRGMTHTAWAALAWTWIASRFERELGIDGLAVVASVGYLSHLVADSLTPSGVKWLYPLVGKSIKLTI